MDHYVPFSLADHDRGCARNSVAALDENPLLMTLVSEVHGYYGDALNLVSAISHEARSFSVRLWARTWPRHRSRLPVNSRQRTRSFAQRSSTRSWLIESCGIQS